MHPNLKIAGADTGVSVLFNEPKLLKFFPICDIMFYEDLVSVLFNEPKLLKSLVVSVEVITFLCFSALQRAEIAEI